MKNSVLIQLLGVFFIALAIACAPSYFGKTYPATQNVDVYLSDVDVKKEHTTMGTTTIDKGFSSMQVVQQKVIEMGKAQGADGVIMKLSEEVVSTQKSGTGVVNKKTKKDVISTSSSTMDIKKKKIDATFIKYN